MDCNPARTKDPDAWLNSAPEFSRGMAAELADLFLRWQPDLQVAIKWNMLCFSARRLVCGISACRRHLGITFFRGVELPDPRRLFSPAPRNTTILSVRLKSMSGLDLPALEALLHAAVELDVQPNAPSAPRVKRPPPEIPPVLARALKRHPAAATAFRKMAPSCQREYIAWLLNARRPETLARRLAITVKAVARGRRWEDREQS